jgi:hypothetical protein
MTVDLAADLGFERSRLGVAGASLADRAASASVWKYSARYSGTSISFFTSTFGPGSSSRRSSVSRNVKVVVPRDDAGAGPGAGGDTGEKLFMPHLPAKPSNLADEILDGEKARAARAGSRYGSHPTRSIPPPASR